MYTVKHLSDLAGVSVRTLHHYDEIGLLAPARTGTNGYRYYDDGSLLRLQQILFYREIGLELAQIKDILDSPHFDTLAALKSHRTVLLGKTERLRQLIQTIDSTIAHLSGGETMSDRQMFEAFSDEQQKDYEREARLRWDADTVNQSVRLWNSYSQAKKDAIGAEGQQIYLDLTAAMESGLPPDSAQTQAILARWHRHMRYFYEPTIEIMRGLGHGYNNDPAFHATFARIHPDLPPYLETAVVQYADELEHAEIVRMLAEDADRTQRR